MRRRPSLEAVQQVTKLGARLLLAQTDGGKDALLDVAPEEGEQQAAARGEAEGPVGAPA